MSDYIYATVKFKSDLSDEMKNNIVTSYSGKVIDYCEDAVNVLIPVTSISGVINNIDVEYIAPNISTKSMIDILSNA